MKKCWICGKDLRIQEDGTYLPCEDCTEDMEADEIDSLFDEVEFGVHK
jgi:hypothetical protein